MRWMHVLGFGFPAMFVASTSALAISACNDTLPSGPSLGACDGAIQRAYNRWYRESDGGKKNYAFRFREEDTLESDFYESETSRFVYRNLVEDGNLTRSESLPSATKTRVSTIEALFNSISKASCASEEEDEELTEVTFDSKRGFPTRVETVKESKTSRETNVIEVQCVGVGDGIEAACPLGNEPNQGLKNSKQ